MSHHRLHLANQEREFLCREAIARDRSRRVAWPLLLVEACKACRAWGGSMARRRRISRRISSSSAARRPAATRPRSRRCALAPAFHHSHSLTCLGLATQIFAEHGEVEEVFVMRGGSRSGQACAFVRFTTAEGAVAAIQVRTHARTVRIPPPRAHSRSDIRRRRSTASTSCPAAPTRSSSAMPTLLVAVRTHP